jgi:2-(1,2-epoxy-1,2-dihydrophenyl)acetyl-CoA isomerase
MEYETLLFDVKDRVAKIVLNRPEAANVIDKTLAQALMQAAIRCDEEAEIRARAVLLTGSGRFFSAGGDLKAFAAGGEAISAGIKELTVYLHAAISRLARMDAPVVVAVNGTAAGGGMSLAVAGDLVVAAESAKFTMAYTAAGLSPDGSATYFLPRLIGLRRSQELMLTNRRLSASEALEWGLVSRVVPDADLLAEAEALARSLGQGPTRALGMVKTLRRSCTGALPVRSRPRWSSRRVGSLPWPPVRTARKASGLSSRSENRSSWARDRSPARPHAAAPRSARRPSIRISPVSLADRLTISSGMDILVRPD